MDSDFAQQAISAALSANWEEAVKLNKQLLKKNKKDVDALNRLARAYAELGDLTKAKAAAKKAIKIDPFNKIATKSLEKWKGLKKGEATKSVPSSPQSFLEEPGKTKIVSLLYLGSSKILAKVDSGDEVKLNPHGHRVSVITMDGKYIGRLPDDLSARLRKLIKYGNEYQVLVKSIQPKDVKIFIREIKRSEALTDIPSFSSERIDYIAFTPPELVHKKVKILPGEEEEQ